MTLDEWLGDTWGKCSALSRKTGISRGHLCKLRYQKEPGTIRAAILIEVGTKGAVQAESIASDQESLKLLAYLRGSAWKEPQAQS